MATVTLKSITCISTMNGSGDAVFLLVNNNHVATLLFSGASTKLLPSPIPVSDNTPLELAVKNNATGVNEKMGMKTAAASPSAIPYRRAAANYGLNYE